MGEQRTLIGGTSYLITGGKTLIGGTDYSIKQGKTLIDGTSKNIIFSPPELILIDGGTSNVSWSTGGNYSGTTWSSQGTYIYFRGPTTKYSAYGYCSTSGLDLSKYTTIHIRGRQYNNNTSGSGYYTRLLVGGSQPTYADKTFNAPGSSSFTEATFDISDITDTSTVIAFYMYKTSSSSNQYTSGYYCDYLSLT